MFDSKFISTKFCICLVQLLFASGLFSQNVPYQFTTFKELDLLANNSVTSFYQDENAKMWINSNAGLVKFNGNRADVVAYPIGMKPIVGNHDFIYCLMNHEILRINIKTNNKELILNGRVNGDSSHISISNNKLFVAYGNTIDVYKDTILHKKNLLPLNEKVTHIYTADKGVVWIGTQIGSVYSITIEGVIEFVTKFDSEITTMFMDSRGQLWVGTFSHGAYNIDKKREIVIRYSSGESEYRKISNNFIRSFCEDKDGQIWVATLDGVNIINIKQRSTVSFSVGSVNEKSILALSSDIQGNIWVGTYYSGLYFFNFSTKVFSRFTTDERIVMVNRMLEDKRGDLWIFTDGFGVLRKHMNANVEMVLKGIKKIKSAYYDHNKDIIWIGTHLEGLYYYSIAQHKLSKVKFADEQMNKDIVVVNDIIMNENTLYLGTSNGVFSIDLNNTDSAYPVSTYRSLVHSLLIDKDNNLWITGVGVYKYNITQRTTTRVSNKMFQSFPDDVQFKGIFQDNKDRIWMSVLRYGLLMIDNNQSILYNRQNVGIGDEFISTINQTKDGVILLGTNSGFSFFFPDIRRGVAYNQSNGYPLRSTRNGCILHRANGEILIGGTTGIALLSSNLETIQQPNSIYFDQLKINNQNVDILDNISVDKLSLTYTEGIELNHFQKNIAIEVASTDYSQIQHTFYEYCLEGYETDWTRFSISLPIIYMNLPSGKYVLKVRAYSDPDMSDVNEIRLPIRALPPWYDTLLAKTGYFVLFLLFVFGVFYFFYSRILFREKLKQQEANVQAKLRFFTNVSHEIRTPLTLITGNLEMFVTERKSRNRSLLSAFENAKKMQELITELLDFEKQVLGYKRLSVSNKDFSLFINNIYNSFQSYATYREINFKLVVEAENLFYCYDYMQLQKVFFNLLMNAFMHTAKGGSVNVEVNLEDLDVTVNKPNIDIIWPKLSAYFSKIRKKSYVKMLTVRVSDTGQGISSKVIDQIFDPFYQDTTNFSHDKYNKGSGIGLSIAKNIVEQHHGLIWAKSKQGEGTVFSVALPTDKYWFKNDPMINEEAHSELVSINNSLNVEFGDNIIDNVLPTGEPIVNNSAVNTEKKTILIVEDDTELLNLLLSVFSPVFNVLKSTNGMDAYSIAEEQQPDIIVSDVMMPVMDGLQLCSKIKGTLATSHILVVLLTARSTEDQNIEGICAGADDYMIKPFSIGILIAKCNALLRNRDALIHKYRHSISTSADTIVSSAQDTLFLQKLVTVIEENINNELGVSLLCAEMAMSKTLLSNKIKKITNQSPAEFIQTLQMKRAAWMILNEPHKSASDIAFELGFSSLGYFGIRFKKHFGKSPTDFKNACSEKNV